MTIRTFDGDLGNLWVQPDGFGTQPRRLLCANSDGFDVPFGGITTRMCRKAGGVYETTRRSKGLPGEVTTDIETYLAATMDWLQKQRIRGCPMSVYIHHGACGDTFLDYDHGETGENAYITNVGSAGGVRQIADAGDGAADAVMRTYSMSAQPVVFEYWNLVLTEDVGGEPEPARSLAADEAQRCASNCQVLYDPLTNGTMVCDSAAAAALSTPEFTVDEFATLTGAATDPFAAAEDIASVVRFWMDKDTERTLVACGTTDAAGLRVAYSDDAGATWTVVQVAAGADYAFWGRALFALDKDHVWLCTQLADVWYSADGGVTWTDQAAPAPAVSESLYAVHFVDENFGWAVGGFATTPTLHMIQTVDGGAHWTTITVEPQVEEATGVTVLDSQNVYVCFGDGDVWLTRDWADTAANWEAHALPSGGLVGAGAITSFGHLSIAVCGYWVDASADEFGTVFRSFDGGYNWERHVHSTTFDGVIEYAGMNDVIMAGFNHVIAVGEIVDSVPILMILKNAGP